MKTMLKSAVAATALLFAGGGLAAEETKQSEREQLYYTLETIPANEEYLIEVSGLTLMPDDRMGILTRRGEIWIAHNISAENPADVSFTKFAEGLHEPMGVFYQEGSLVVTQRSELTRIADSNGDGKADRFTAINSDWGVSGDYHEFAFGSAPDRDGNVWIALCLTDSKSSEAFLRGWAVRITPEGEMIPSASGIRSPGGIGEDAEGRMYYTDNQGFWNGSSSLKHLVPGSFQGAAVANKWYDDPRVDMGARPADPDEETLTVDAREDIPELVPPAVIFPHGRVGQSPTGMAWDNTGGDFGPFSKQLFVAEYTHSQIQRVFLEEVNGVMQGAVFHFMEDFATGNMNVVFGNNGDLIVGGLSRGWPSRGNAPFAIQRIDWTGKTPFEILEMRATPNGFDIEFTLPVDKALAADPANYSMEAWTYLYRELYGSPEVYQETPEITAAKVWDDGKTVSLTIDGLEKGHVHMLKIGGVKASDGTEILHAEAYYTLNEIPE